MLLAACTLWVLRFSFFFSFDILSLLNIPYLVCNSSLGYVLGNMSLLVLFPFPGLSMLFAGGHAICLEFM